MVYALRWRGYLATSLDEFRAANHPGSRGRGNMAKKIYQQIMVVSILAFIPVTLAAGLATGYIVGHVLEQQFKLPGFVFVTCLILGVVGSMVEVVRLLRLAMRTEKDKSS